MAIAKSTEQSMQISSSNRRNTAQYKEEQGEEAIAKKIYSLRKQQESNSKSNILVIKQDFLLNPSTNPPVAQ